MSTEMGSKNGILIRIMTMEDFEEVKICIRNNFILNGEPLGLWRDYVQQENGDKNGTNKYFISMIEQNTCLVAVDENNNGRIVGLVLACVECPSDVEQHRKDVDQMEESTKKRILQLVYKAEQEVNLYERYAVSKLLDSFITTVEVSYRGKGLGTRLAAALMEVGRAKGIPLMAAFCTSFYSARQKKAMGMECVLAVSYADYKDANGQVVFQPAAPHTHMRVMAIKL